MSGCDGCSKETEKCGGEDEVRWGSEKCGRNNEKCDGKDENHDGEVKTAAGKTSSAEN